MSNIPDSLDTKHAYCVIYEMQGVETYVVAGEVHYRKPKGPTRSPLERAQKNPKSLRAAIDAKCFQCQGEGQDPGTWARVRECTIPDCGLYLARRK